MIEVEGKERGRDEWREVAWKKECREREERRMTERERDIFSGAVRGGDIMEHNWEGGCVCLQQKERELVLQSIVTGGENVCGGCLTHKSVARNERDNSAIKTWLYTHKTASSVSLKSQTEQPSRHRQTLACK